MCLTCQLVIEGSLVSTSHRVGVGIDAAATATLNDGVEDGAALAGIGIAQEQPVLFSKSGRPNGVFHKVIVYLHSAIFEMGVVYQMTSEGRQGRALRRQAAELESAAEQQDWAEEQFSTPLPTGAVEALQNDEHVGRAMAQAEVAAKWLDQANDSPLRSSPRTVD